MHDGDLNCWPNCHGNFKEVEELKRGSVTEIKQMACGVAID